MLLNEFFGKPVKLGRDQNKEDTKNHSDDIFWFILDHDKLHKNHFFPVANKIQKGIKTNKLKKDECVMELAPMVNRGCMEFYHTNKLKGKPNKLFPKEMRKDLGERLFDHYFEGIKNGDYELGQ
jgi:hypothetical protein